MEEINLTLIERYLAQELTTGERSDFERRVQQDAQLKQELAEYTLAMEALKLAQREELKDRFRQRDRILDRQNRHVNPGRTRNLWMLSAAAVLALLLSWRLFTVPEHTLDQAKNEPQDSTQMIQNPPVNIDTIKSPELEKGDKKENKPRQATKDKGQVLFAANFEPYTDESMDPTSRSGEDELTEFERFQLSYWDKNYKEASDSFKKLSPSMQQNDNIRFMYANALMGLKQTDEAAVILTEVVKNPKAVYKTEALYYLALCEIKNGKYAEARKNLETYMNDPESVQKEKALKILTDLN